jgi:hypothetical protein
MKRQLYKGGGIMGLSKEGIGGGSIKGVDMGSRIGFFNPVKAAKKLAKKATKTVKKIASSDLGKAALLYAGTAGLGALGAGAARATTGFGGIFNPSNVMSNLGASFINFKSTPFGEKIFGKALADDPKRSGGILQNLLGAVTGKGTGTGSGILTKGLALAGLSTFLTSKFGMTPEQAEETIANPESRALYLRRYYENLNPNAQPEEVEQFVAANVAEYAVGGRVGFDEGTPREGIESLMKRTLPEDEEMVVIIDYDEDGNPRLIQVPKSQVMPDMAGYGFMKKSLPIVVDNKMDSEDIVIPMDKDQVLDGIVTRDNRREGNPLPPDPTQPVNPFKPKPIGPVLPNKMMASNMENDKILEALFEKYLDMGFSPKEAADKAMEEFDRMSMMKTEGRGLAAIGGKMDTASDNAMQAAGVEGLPVRQNPKGVKELDLRKTGGFIPPVGIKEKADDIPAMLSNNEFVFTADAVRGMGDGNVNVGAQRMYDMMKKLEAGGRV